MFKKENLMSDFWNIFFPLLIIFYIFITYNLVDTYFAGLIWEKAIVWLQIAFPMFFLLLAINEGIWTAMNNLTSISLWEGKDKNIARYFTVWFILSLVFGLVFAIFSNEIINVFFYFSNNLDLEVQKYAFEYSVVLFHFSFLFIFSWILWQLLIIYKKRNAQIIMALLSLILNITFDFIFVKYLWYEVIWIAYATIVTWFSTVTFWSIYILYYEKITKFTKKISINYFKKFLSFWISTSSIMFLVMWTIMVDNYFLAFVWDEALSAYWIWTRLKDFLFYPLIVWSIAFSVLYWFYFWEKNYKVLKELTGKIVILWIIYAMFLFICLPVVWKLFWWYFTSNILTLDYLFIYMISLSVTLFWITFEFIYSSILQVTSHHKAIVLLNVLYLILVFLFEYIFYNLYWTYISIWIWAITGSLIVSFLTYLYYKVIVEKELKIKFDWNWK
jgi:Na+-driven multidrug efflux pump